MSSLSDSEYLILDEAYFVTSYRSILENTGYDEDVFQQTLISLLKRKFIVQLKYNEVLKDFEKLDTPDLSSLTSSSFVATKEGLLIHNSRD